MASSDKSIDLDPRGAAPPGASRGGLISRRAFHSVGAWRSDGAARWVFIWPSVIIVLLLSIFPLFASLTLAFGKLVFQKGEVNVDFVGLSNFTTLLFGTERTHLLGLTRTPTPLGWLVLIVVVAAVVGALARSLSRGTVGVGGAVLRVAVALFAIGLAALVAQTMLSDGGRPGSLVVTLFYVFAGIAVTYVLGLGLAILTVQPLRGRRFFRVVFLLPLTITPIGVGYMFRMMTDTGKGPLEPLFAALGLSQYTWVTDPWAARIAVVIGDAWQWTPFVFIVLLAALEGLDQEVREAAVVDGASRWRAFRHITWPAILPVSVTIVLIRMIEGFKIVDMPNILTGGGPGTATESLTLEAYLDWRTFNLGSSAAIAYILLILVTVIASVYIGWTAALGGAGLMRNPLRRRSPLDLSPGSKVVAYALLIGWSIVVLFPLYWLAVTSLKLPIQVDKGPYYIPFVDFQPTLDAWENILFDLGNDTLRPYVNSVIVAFSSAVICTALGASAAYALVRFDYRPRVALIVLAGMTMVGAYAAIFGGVPWPVAVVSALAVFLLLAQTIGRRFRRTLGNRDLAFWLISQRILPPIAVVVPLYVLFQQIDLLDSHLALILTYIASNLPIVVWLMRDYFAALPIELEEAAQVDGASVYRIVRSVVLPIAVPGLVATFLITLIFSWNEYLIALILTSANARTMPLLVAAQDATRGPQWWAMSVLVLIMILPVIVMAIVLERFISRGILIGAVKG